MSAESIVKTTGSRRGTRRGIFLVARCIVSDWAVEEFRALRLEEIDVRYARYRLSLLEAEEAMARSLRRYGQIARSWSACGKRFRCWWTVSSGWRRRGA